MPQRDISRNIYIDGNNSLFDTILLSDDKGTVVHPALSEDTIIKFGQLTNYSLVNVYGRFPSVVTTGVPIDIWEHGGLYTGQPLTGTAETLTITSASASDNGATVYVEGLDGNYNKITETVTLSGATTPTATTTNTFWRSYKAYVMTPATGQISNAGIITANMSTTTANIMWSILAGNGETRVAAYTTPAGYTSLMRNYRASIVDNNANSGTIEFVLNSVGGAQRFSHPVGVSNTSNLTVNIYGGILIPEKTDMVMRLTSVGGNGGDITGQMDIIEYTP